VVGKQAMAVGELDRWLMALPSAMVAG
jgi:hypothetical protein